MFVMFLMLVPEEVELVYSISMIIYYRYSYGPWIIMVKGSCRRMDKFRSKPKFLCVWLNNKRWRCRRFKWAKGGLCCNILYDIPSAMAIQMA